MKRPAPDTVPLRVQGIDAELTYKAMRTIRLRVLPPDGRVAVSAPIGVPAAEVEAFVASNRAWIVRNQAKVRLAAPVKEPLVDGGTALLWGNPFTVSVQDAPRPRGVIEDAIIELRGSTQEALEQALEEVYRSELADEIGMLRARWEPAVGRSASQIRLRRMKTRWGSCNTRSAAITLNTALAERTPDALEYVLVHELVHLHERGHGPKFVAWMNALMPDWRVRRSRLRGAP